MKTIVVAFSGAFIFLACTTTQPVEIVTDSTPATTVVAPIDTAFNPTEPVAIAGTWELYSMDGSTTPWQKIPVLSLEGKAGAFNTTTYCKGMTGRFVAQGTSCVFDNEVITTKMGCTPGDNEDRYLQMLLRVNNYAFTDSLLQLKIQNAVAFSFKKQPI
jgi:hypothetical protein